MSEIEGKEDMHLHDKSNGFIGYKQSDARSTPDVSTEHNMTTTQCKDKSIDDIKTNKARGLPIDRGWAWVVLAGMSFYLMLFGGIRKNYGLFFIAFQSRFNSSASLTSLLTTMQSMSASFCSLFVMTIGMHYISNRTSIMIGATLLTIGNIINAYATDIRFLFVSFGLFDGVGHAMTHPPMIAMLGEYFDRKRALASGLAFSGANFGSLIFAPLMTYLFQTLGYTSTLMIVAGIYFNIVVSGALMRPINSYECVSKGPKIKMENTEDSTNEYKHEDKSNHNIVKHLNKNATLLADKDDATSVVHSMIKNNNLETKSDELNELIISTINNKTIAHLKVDDYANKLILRSESYDPETCSIGNKDAGSPLLPRFRTWSVGNTDKRPRTDSQTSHKNVSIFTKFNVVETLNRSKLALYSSTDGLFVGSVVDIKEISNDTTEDTLDEDKTEQNSVSCCVSFRKSGIRNLKRIFDTSLFKNRVFPVFMLMAMFYAPSCGLISICFAPHSKDVGLTQEQTGILLSVVGGCGLFARVSAALFADRNYVRLTTLIAVPAFVIGLATHCIRFFTSFHSLLAFAVIIGFTCELYQAMYACILVEYLTLAKLKSAIGFNVLSNGVAMAIMFPVVGALRDATGDYHASYHLLGTMAIAGGCLSLSVPYVNKLNKEK